MLLPSNSFNQPGFSPPKPAAGAPGRDSPAGGDFHGNRTPRARGGVAWKKKKKPHKNVRRQDLLGDRHWVR